MKKRILLPTSFFFSVLFTVFLFGLMIGIIGISIWIFKNPDSQRVPQSEKISNWLEAEAIVEVDPSNDKFGDGDTIYIKSNEDLENKLNQKLKDKLLNTKIYKEGKKISVHLLGIDAPEDKDDSPEKSFYATEAKDKVIEEINNQSIKITWNNSEEGLNLSDSKNSGKNPRLEGYVRTQKEKGVYSIFLNELMIKEGYAETKRRDRAIEHHPEEENFKKLEHKAKQENIGKWNKDEEIKWQKNQGMIPSEEVNTYVIIGDYFHREWCKYVSNAEHYKKKYSETRNKIGKTPCKFCNP